MTTPPEDYVSYYASRRLDIYGEAYTGRDAESHSILTDLKRFISECGLADKKCLEIGSSGGAFQDIVEDYYGTDISADLASRYHKPYRVCEGTSYPFDDETFDAIWTIATYEHIPHLQEAMLEIVRLLKPGGYVFFAPAWQCRSWAADGYEVRPYSDFGWRGKLIKASIPLRNSILWRSLWIFPKRVARHLAFKLGKRYRTIRYGKIKANYEVFWTYDSDACNHIDPHDAILWFESHGLTCVSDPMDVAAFMVRTGVVIARKNFL